jgi:hypothetical protein
MKRRQLDVSLDLKRMAAESVSLVYTHVISHVEKRPKAESRIQD